MAMTKKKSQRQWLRDSAYEMFRLCPISYNYRFSLFSREIKLCYKLHTIFSSGNWLLSHDYRIFTKMTKKVPVLIGSLICCCVLDKVYSIDHSFVEGLDTNLHKIHRSLLQDDTGKFMCCDFTYFFKLLSSNSLDFRFRSFHALHIQKLSNCCRHK